MARAERLPGPGETVLGSSYAEHAGGKGLNQAVAAARSGASTCFVGALGTDDAGRRLRDVLAADSIDSSGVVDVTDPTGRALIVVDHGGENSIVVVPGANALVRADITTPPATVVLAQLEVPLASVNAAFAFARGSGSITVLNPAPATPLPHDLVELCDVIVPNEHELALLGGSDALLAAGCGAVVVTLGAAGAEIITEHDRDRIAPFAVDVVDTTGAGDAFCGALAARLAAGDDVPTAARWGAAAGALATTLEGAVPAQPTERAVRELLAR